MVTLVRCDVCFAEIHKPRPALQGDEPRYRVDLHRPGETRGFDTCQDCFYKVAAVMQVAPG